MGQFDSTSAPTRLQGQLPEGVAPLYGQPWDQIPPQPPAWAQELVAGQRRIEAQLVLLIGKLATSPSDLVGAMGEALAKAQGYDRPIAMTDLEGNDLIQTPGIVVYEPENEAWDRAEPDWSDPLANQSWWETMTPGEQAPPGELDSEGP